MGNGFNTTLSEPRKTNIKLSFICGIQIEIYNYMTLKIEGLEGVYEREM